MSDEKNKDKKDSKEIESKLEDIKKHDDLVDIQNNEESNSSEDNELKEEQTPATSEHKDTSSELEDEDSVPIENSESPNEEVKHTNEYVDENNAPEEKPKKKSFTSNIMAFGVILISLFAFAFIYTYTITQDNTARNTLVIQKEITNTTHLLDMYAATGDEKFVTLAYGNLKETEELLRQTLLEQSSIDFFIHPRSNYELLHFLDKKVTYLESTLQGEDFLAPQEVSELYIILSSINEQIAPTSNINKFVRQTDFLINGECHHR